LKYYSTLLLILLFIGLDGFGQKLLFHKNRRREAFYKVGDQISFRIKGSKAKYTETIVSFEDSVIVFENAKLHPSKISHLYADHKTSGWYFFRFKYQRILPRAAIAWILVDLLNTATVQKKTFVISGSLVGAGLLAKWLIGDRIKIKPGMKLLIMD
jgi:hypothetical protein